MKKIIIITLMLIAVSACAPYGYRHQDQGHVDNSGHDGGHRATHY